jgi:tetratricopeptide (TPR) repeat protein
MSRNRIEELIAQERWADARKQIERELKTRPDSHWLLTRLSTTYYEEMDYSTALGLVLRAYGLAPNCPLVLWDLAGTLDALGQKRPAIEIYQRLLSRGVSNVANDECGEGEAWAESLLADCHYRIAGCYEDLGLWQEATAHYEQHSKALDAGVQSIYTREDTAARLDRLSAILAAG